MWVVNFVVVRDGERSPDDGSPRFLDSNVPFPVPDIDQSVIHRGEMFVVDDVVWNLEKKTVSIEIVPTEEEKGVFAPPTAEIEIEDDVESNESNESDDVESDTEPEG